MKASQLDDIYKKVSHLKVKNVSHPKMIRILKIICKFGIIVPML